MISIETGIILWAIGAILCLLFLILFWGFDDGHGNIEITFTRILCYVLISLIANWAIVVFYLIVGGIYLLVWIGEACTKATDITIYKSNNSKKKKK